MKGITITRLTLFLEIQFMLHENKLIAANFTSLTPNADRSAQNNKGFEQTATT